MPPIRIRLTKPKIPTNLFVALERRRSGIHCKSLRNVYRYNNRIMANLVASPNYYFAQVDSLPTRGQVFFDCPGKLYTDNNKRCYTLRGAKGNPALLYELDTQRGADKYHYHDSITILRAGMAGPNLPKADLRLLLTSDNRVQVRHEPTGALIQELDLNVSNIEKAGRGYASMHHEMHSNQVIVISNKSRTCDHYTLMHIVLLDICPEIRTRLRIIVPRLFNRKQAVNAVLVDGILRITWVDFSLTMYDFEQILALNPTIPGPHERHMYIKVLSEPLLTIKSFDDSVGIGGFPWKYITNEHKNGYFEVRSLCHKLIEKFNRDDPRYVSFHGDESERVIYMDGHGVTHYSTEVRPDGTQKLKTCKRFTLVPATDSVQVAPLMSENLRRSARIRSLTPQRYEEDNDEPTVLDEDFENELDITTLLGNDRSLHHQDQGTLQMFNTATGEMIRRMQFNGTLYQFSAYSVTLDLDVLMVTVKPAPPSTHRETLVYRLMERVPSAGRDQPTTYHLPVGLRPAIIDFVD